MKRNALTYLLLPFLLALLVTACKDDTPPASPAEEEEAGSGVYVSVVVNTGGSNASRVPTPGEGGDGPQAGTVEESTVHDLNVFFFQGDVDESTGERLGINSPNAANIRVHSLYFSSEDLHYMEPDASNNYDAVYSVTKEVSEFGLNLGETYDVLVIANKAKEIEANNLSFLQNFFDHAISSEQEGNSDNKRYFRMASASSETDCITIKPNNSITQPEIVNINVERATARVDYHIAYPKDKSYFTSGNAMNDQVEILGATLVNKNKDALYMFKRVTENTDLNNVKIVYLGDEKIDENGIASNYVLDLNTTQPLYKNYDMPFSTTTEWNINDFENTSITSTDKNGVTYYFLDYAEENVVSKDLAETQCAKYCTGIVFKAKYTPAGITPESDGSFYQYNNKFYGTLDQIKNELGVGYIGPVDMERYGITKYEGGICYYTYWIKHADDGDDTKVSPMEYAIVRNNIYQINVTGVSGIGTVTPTDYGLYLTCTVVDWVEENEITIDFNDNYDGDFNAQSVKEASFENEEWIIVAYSQDNMQREAQFTFKMNTPVGATWTAHLTNPDDFEFDGDYYGVGGDDKPTTLTIRPRRVFEEGNSRTTEMYITTDVFEESVAFNTSNLPGEETAIRIRQVSTTEYDNN